MQKILSILSQSLELCNTETKKKVECKKEIGYNENYVKGVSI
jgi:hypothetical protein